MMGIQNIGFYGIFKSKIFSALIVLALLLVFNLFFSKNFFVITPYRHH